MRRIVHHPILQEDQRTQKVTITVDGTEIEAFEGEMIAAALGCYDKTTCDTLVKQAWERRDALRCGKFGETRKISKDRLVALGKES